MEQIKIVLVKSCGPEFWYNKFIGNMFLAHACPGNQCYLNIVKPIVGHSNEILIDSTLGGYGVLRTEDVEVIGQLNVDKQKISL